MKQTPVELSVYFLFMKHLMDRGPEWSNRPKERRTWWPQKLILLQSLPFRPLSRRVSSSKGMEEVQLTYSLADELRIPQLTGLQMRYPIPSLLLQALAGICHGWVSGGRKGRNVETKLFSQKTFIDQWILKGSIRPGGSCLHGAGALFVLTPAGRKENKTV